MKQKPMSLTEFQKKFSTEEVISQAKAKKMKAYMIKVIIYTISKRMHIYVRDLQLGYFRLTPQKGKAG
jgi:hypothetical protein